MGKSAILQNATVTNTTREHSTKELLEQELAGAKLLHRLSIELIQEKEISGLYKKIVEAAVAIMGSQYGSMQMLVSDTGMGKLRLLASYNFDEAAEKFWEWVYPHTGSSCGATLLARQRVIVNDFSTSEFMRDKPTLPVFLEAGIYAAQSTPLYSRSGKLLGMISTHWSYPYNPPERHLYLLDVLARQAADLIERAQTNEALRQSEERLRALATATNEAIYRMSPDWSEMYQLDGRNFLNDTSAPIGNWMTKYIHPDDVDHVTRVINRAIETKSVFQLEHRMLQKDNTYGWTFSRAVPIFDASGNIIEWFGAASDISEKKVLLSGLEKEVEKRTEQLRRSNDDLQQFAHVASHDLKEPVRKIQIFGSLLKDDPGSNQRMQHYTDKILQSANRMSMMIEGVLKYSSLGVVEDQFQEVDVNKLVNNVLNDLEIFIQDKKAVIRIGAMPAVEGIEVLMYQLFYNLIYNSLKFSSKDPLITLTADNSAKDRVKITVTDNGIGFNPAYNEVIFKTFKRLHALDKFEGTGLGLALAKKIVDRHNGSIEASGKENEGATFIVTLPRKRTSAGIVDVVDTLEH